METPSAFASPPDGENAPEIPRRIYYLASCLKLFPRFDESRSRVIGYAHRGSCIIVVVVDPIRGLQRLLL
jgi:hypothetical protein